MRADAQRHPARCSSRGQLHGRIRASITPTMMSPLARSNKDLVLLEVVFLAILASRSVTELLSGATLFVGPLSLSVSVVAMILMDAVGLLYLALCWRRGPLPIERIGMYVFCWALALAPWVVLAAHEFGAPGLNGAREWVRLLSLALVFFVTYSIARRHSPEWVVNACLLALPIPLILAYVELGRNLVSGASGNGVRLLGSMAHPNILAAFLVVMIGLTIWKLGNSLHRRRRKGNAFGWGVLMVLQLPPLVMTVSSNGWGMLGVMILVVIFALPGRRVKAVAAAAGLVLLGAAVWLGARQPRLVSEVLGNLRDIGLRAGDDLQMPGLSGRLDIWHNLLGQWQHRPWFGFGLNTARFLDLTRGLAAHNDYLRYLGETGAIGLLLFVGLLALIGRRLFQLLRSARGGQHYVLIAVAAGMTVAWILGGIADNLISYTAFQVYLWATLAAACAGTPLSPARLHQALTTDDRSGGSSTVAAEARATKPRRSRTRRTGLALFAGATPLLGGAGFYLWNQGVTAEAYFLGWLLVYGALTFALRHQKTRYMRTLLATALGGLVAVQVQFQLPEQTFRTAALSAAVALAALFLFDGVASFVGSHRCTKDRWYRAFFQSFGRHMLVPSGALAIAALSLRGLLDSATRFLDGYPLAFAILVAWLAALLAAIGAICWAQADETGKPWRTELRHSGVVLLLVGHFGSLLAAAGLWGVSRLLPAISALERFAPLHRQRTLGLYTWPVAAGTLIALLVALFLRRRTSWSRSSTPHSPTSPSESTRDDR